MSACLKNIQILIKFLQPSPFFGWFWCDYNVKYKLHSLSYSYYESARLFVNYLGVYKYHVTSCHGTEICVSIFGLVPTAVWL